MAKNRTADDFTTEYRAAIASVSRDALNTEEAKGSRIRAKIAELQQEAATCSRRPNLDACAAEFHSSGVLLAEPATRAIATVQHDMAIGERALKLAEDAITRERTMLGLALSRVTMPLWKQYIGARLQQLVDEMDSMLKLHNEYQHTCNADGFEAPDIHYEFDHDKLDSMRVALKRVME